MPTLIALYGPLKGSTFFWSEHEYSLGRDASNAVSIPDPLVSRNHCKIRLEGDEFLIQDLESRNGLFINGVPVKSRVLQHGDQIEIGDSLFLFLFQQENQTPSKEKLKDQLILPHFTTKLRLEEALYFEPSKFLGKLPFTLRTKRDLGVLLKTASSFHSFQTLEELKTRLLELLFEATPADRAAVLLGDDSNSDDSSTFKVDKNRASADFSVSQSLIDKVTTERIAVLCNDIHQDDESLKTSLIHSVICVPMRPNAQMVGIVYLDTSNPAIQFDDQHLQVVTAIAGIAGLVWKDLQEKMWLIEEHQRLQTEISRNLIGETPGMKKVYDLIARVAPTESTVLISGESGTGKELVARAIHQSSLRKNSPFVAINCAVLSETLFESELFGHEKGAFTGAIAQKKGKLETAQGGTVFLDEISEIPVALQAKLLRVIQEREFEHVGGTRSMRSDVRWIAATNRNLEEGIQAGTFRQDLFYRLNVVNLILPPLRERKQDIALLANYFVSKYSKEMRRRVKGISARAMECLNSYHWPGNIRELQNAIERAIVLGNSELVQAEDLPEQLIDNAPSAGANKTGYHEVLRETKKQLVLKALQQTGRFKGI